MKYIFILENLNCANCAAKIEKKIANTNGYENVSFNFANKKLTIESSAIVTADIIQKICDSIEDGVNVIDTNKKSELAEYTLILNDLNCANCAGKIEKKIANTSGFEDVTFNFANKKLKLKTNHSDVVNEIQQICDSIEDGVKVTFENDNTEHHHHDNCTDICCDSHKHEHTHLHEHAKEKSKDKKSLNLNIIGLIISAVFGISSFVLELVGFENLFSNAWIIMFLLSSTAAVLSGYKTFIKGFKSLFKLNINETTLMTIAVIAAFVIGEYVEGAMVTVLFALGEIIEDKAVNSSRKDIEKLAQIRPDNATLLLNGFEKVVSAESVEIGSTIIVKPHERIPLDGVIIEGNTTLDTSALTGESVPIDGGKGTTVLSGMINGNSLIKIKTTKEFGDSTAARILKLVEDAAATKGQSEKFISKFASVYTPIIIAISLIVAILPPALGFGSFSTWIYRALVCLVASCPCAIVISVPLSFYSGIGSASKNGVLVKGGKYLEALAKADAFVFDKTGTLTTGKLSVSEVFAYNGKSKSEVLTLAAACEKYSSHPIAMAIKTKAEKLDLPELSDFSEKAGHGVSATFNGKKISCGGAKILTENQKNIAEKNASVYLIEDNLLVGAISVNDSLRDEAKSVINELSQIGVKDAIMLTGDKKENAKNIADKLELSNFYAELMPSDKLEKLNNIKKSHKSVCFVGDGINDAPVLTASDCGFAMGFGSEVAIESADIVLASGNLKQLPKAIKIAKKVISTVKTNITFALLVKTIVISLAIVGFAPMWLSVIADTGVSVICVLYAARLLKN